MAHGDQKKALAEFAAETFALMAPKVIGGVVTDFRLSTYLRTCNYPRSLIQSLSTAGLGAAFASWKKEDIARLPETGVQLFGRDKELQLLDEMWAKCRAERSFSLFPRIESKVKWAWVPVISTAIRIISFFSKTVKSPPTNLSLFMRMGSSEAKWVIPLSRVRIYRALNPFPFCKYDSISKCCPIQSANNLPSVP